MAEETCVKIQYLDSLKIITETMRENHKTIVQCHGCFDVLHIGHIKHFQEASQWGHLIVTVTSDRYINKGKNRPLFGIKDRIEMIAALECVDYVAMADHDNAAEAIRIIKPHYYAKGIDYADRGVAEAERVALKETNAKLVFTTSEKYSTTELIERLK